MKGKKMKDSYITLCGIPVAGIERDIKDGKYILKSNGIINTDVHAQTVIVYGNVIGDIKADEVVLINGKCTGNIHADTVVGLEQPQKKEGNCKKCKHYHPYNMYDGSWLCTACPAVRKVDLKPCNNYQEKKNPAKQVSSPRLPVRKSLIK